MEESPIKDYQLTVRIAEAKGRMRYAIAQTQAYCCLDDDTMNLVLEALLNEINERRADLISAMLLSKALGIEGDEIDGNSAS